MSKIEVTLIAALIASALVPAYFRASGKEPKYLSAVNLEVKKACILEAESHGHNVGWIGGSDAEYFVALEDCIKRRQDEVAQQSAQK